jgi:hypothetical protein
MSLRNFLETIRENLHFFDEANFRERLNNVFVDSLAATPRRPEPSALNEDLKSVSPDDPLVKNLVFWRHNYFAHRSRTGALNPQAFGQQKQLRFVDIETLIGNGIRIVITTAISSAISLSTLLFFRPKVIG